MSATKPTVEADARLDDLRRRLYRADATDEDVRRYLDEGGAADVAPVAPPPVAPPKARRDHRWVLGAGVAVVAASVLIAGVRLGQPSAPTATPRATAVQQDVGDGRVITVDGRASGPTPVPASIDGTAVVGQRFQGYGSAVVAFEPPEGSFRGGRVQIEVTSSHASQVSWKALIMLTRMDWTSYPVVAAHGAAEDRSGAHAPSRFVYPSRPPTRVAVEAPAGVSWTLVVAISTQIAPDLH